MSVCTTIYSYKGVTCNVVFTSVSKEDCYSRHTDTYIRYVCVPNSIKTIYRYIGFTCQTKFSHTHFHQRHVKKILGIYTIRPIYRSPLKNNIHSRTWIPHKFSEKWLKNISFKCKIINSKIINAFCWEGCPTTIWKKNLPNVMWNA